MSDYPYHFFFPIATLKLFYAQFLYLAQYHHALDVSFCIDALEEALEKGSPEIFNSDQGSQFTSKEFTERLLSEEIKISMDGRGRVFDNIFIERLWRSVKYEDIYLRGYETGKEVKEGLSAYFPFYNNERFHQALGYRTPEKVYYN
ncbi:MAG TPA: hypothetical protein ENH24_03265 [Nitrospirae bacterium]|nr:hypothetical protein [Nitrospirota bacterium]